MSNPPPDIGNARAEWLEVTGLAGNAIGIAADPAHLGHGGYHCGSLDLKKINAVKADDYSIRQPRDRAYYEFEVAHGGNFASATDIGADWPNGGRAAWLRFNNLLRAELGANAPALAAVRGLNFSPDGVTRRRFDCLTDKEGPSQDTVSSHTHVEFWRDTIQQAVRRTALERITALMRQAITGQSAAGQPKGTNMIRVMVQNGDGAVWLTGPTPYHIGPDLDADLNAAGVPLVRVNDAATLNAVLSSQRVATASGASLPTAAEIAVAVRAELGDAVTASVDSDAIAVAVVREFAVALTNGADG